MRILVKPWMGREDGRVKIVNHNKVIFSTHYRNKAHLEAIITDIKTILG